MNKFDRSRVAVFDPRDVPLLPCRPNQTHESGMIAIAIPHTLDSSSDVPAAIVSRPFQEASDSNALGPNEHDKVM